MMPRRLALLFIAVLLSAAAPAPLESPAERWRVAAVLDGDTLELEDGRRLRLAGIEAPKPPPNADPGRRWPFAEAATGALRALALGHQVSPRGEVVMDRHGRLLAQLLRDDGLWLQGELLAHGHARVHTRPDARALAHAMLAAEAEARTAERGLWRSRFYAVRPADSDALRRDRDSFQVVEGRVLSVSKSSGEVYLDFGEDWRTDVSVHIARGALRDFAKAGIDPLSYEGRLVRVRGWVGLRAGPLIEATHPEQIERLDETAPAPRTARSGATAPPEDAGDEDGE